MPVELIAFVSAMLPITELRLTIPWAILSGGLSPVQAWIWAVAGNSIAVVIGLYLLEPVTRLLRARSQTIDHLVARIFEKTRHTHSRAFNRFGAIGLVTFIAVPLPGTGGYTGALIAHVFGLKRWAAAILIAIGIAVSGGVMVGVTTGGIRAFEFLRPAAHLPEPLEDLLLPVAPPRSSTESQMPEQ